MPTSPDITVPRLIVWQRSGNTLSDSVQALDRVDRVAIFPPESYYGPTKSLNNKRILYAVEILYFIFSCHFMTFQDHGFSGFFVIHVDI